MDMDMSGMTTSSSTDTPLSPDGVDFSNATQAMDFLGEVLDDTTLQVVGNAYARYFWYGVVVVIGLAGMVNVFSQAVLRSRSEVLNHQS